MKNGSAFAMMEEDTFWLMAPEATCETQELDNKGDVPLCPGKTWAQRNFTFVIHIRNS